MYLRTNKKVFFFISMGHFLIEKDITFLEVQSFKHKNVSLISMNPDKI